MTTRIDELKRWSKDLRQEEPRSPEQKLGGIRGAARMLDKCRASLLGLEREYKFDQQVFHDAGISSDDFKDVVATGASDVEVAEWLKLNARQNVA
jgi:hypothetical protein